jgi:outer membrane biosynthesis protein TonB
MIAIQQQREPFINGRALTWTVGTHLLLFLVFFLFRYAMPVPPPVTDAGGGLEVNLGTSEDGSGHNQPMDARAPAEYKASVVYKSAPAKSALPKEIVQTTEADAPEVANKNNAAKNTVAPVAEAKPKPRAEEKPKYSYPGDQGQGGNNAAQTKPGSGEGNGAGHGDKGVPGGTPGAPNYSGSPGNGTGGIGHTLASREMYPKSFIAEFSESGTVVIHVTIDKKGNIVAKTVISTSNPELTKIALEKLKTVHYSASDDSNPQDFDNITIRFQTRQ